MKKTTLVFAALFLAAGTSVTHTQSAKLDSAYYITKEDIDIVNKTPGIDRTIAVVDIGDEHFAVGVIHRGSTTQPPAPAANTRPCGVAEASPAPNLVAGLTHDKQTEGYYIISGEGTLVTGGHIVNGRTEPPNSEVVTTLNGPSCRGRIGGANVVKRFVKTGDIVIIPPGVPHGWAEVKDHVDYLSFRPSGDLFTPGYVHPSLKK